MQIREVLRYNRGGWSVLSSVLLGNETIAIRIGDVSRHLFFTVVRVGVSHTLPIHVYQLHPMPDITWRNERPIVPNLGTPRPATSRALRVRSVPGSVLRVSPKTGVSEGVSHCGTPPFSGTLPRRLRARRARETLVVGRGVPNARAVPGFIKLNFSGACPQPISL